MSHDIVTEGRPKHSPAFLSALNRHCSSPLQCLPQPNQSTIKHRIQYRFTPQIFDSSTHQQVHEQDRHEQDKPNEDEVGQAREGKAFGHVWLQEVVLVVDLSCHHGKRLHQ